MNAEITCPKCKKRVQKNLMMREHIRPRFLDPDSPSGVVRICKECSILESDLQYMEYKTLAISKNREPYKSFLEGMYELDAMLGISLPDRKLSLTMARILFATAITSMETYLSDTFINRVVDSEDFLRRCVETDSEFKNRRLDLADIFKRKEALQSEVKIYLADVLFHNLAKVRLMYKSVLGVEFPADLAPIFKAIETRHDIVHRGGKTKSGALASVTVEEVRSLIVRLKVFVKEIEGQLSNTK